MLDHLSHPLKNSHFSASNGKWLDNADEVFSYLEQGKSKQENWPQSMNTTLNLLRQAHSIIEQFETRIKEQEIRISELQKLSTTDELTGLVNRRGIFRSFERELDRVNRGLSEGGLLVMIDLDNFKVINDKFGHDAGDAALHLVASALNADCRKMDIIGRLGGDEFVMLFVNTTRKEALERAQSLIQKLNNLSFIWHSTEIPLRASLGLKEYRKGSTIHQIFAAADADMYDSKKETKLKA